jgi:hypothetical protein
MAPVRYIGLLALVIAAAACSEEETPIPYDSTTQNLHLQGTVSGFDLDTASSEALEGEREYSPSRLCEVTASFDITTIEGAMWSIDIELDNFDPGSFGVGRYTVAGPDVAITAGQVGSELRLDGEAAHHERSALGGYIEIKAYDSTAVQAGNPGVLEGGSFGAVFEMDFGAGEVLEGTFHVDLNLTTLEEEEC